MIARGKRFDFRPHELALASLVAVAVPLVAGFAMAQVKPHQEADTAAIGTDSTPIRVEPVIDLESPLLKLGGKKVRAKLPDRWIKQQPIERVKHEAHVSTKAGQKAADVPDADLSVSDADKAPKPDAELAKEVDVEVDASADADPSNTDVEGHADGTADGTETDPLKARAVNMYHSRILSFLTRPFRSQCAGLKKEDFKTCRPSATVRVGGDGVVTSFSFNPCGNGPIDAAAKSALGSIVGQSVPPPPENYPDLRPSSFAVAYVCH